jgi:nucleoside-diphosphate-sugar epimerase
MNGCDVVVHLAAIPHPHPPYRFENYFINNVDGTNIVAKAAVSNGVKRLVFASSTAYYGAQRGFPFSPGKRRGGFDENKENAVQAYMGHELPEMTPYNESCLAYACSKVAAETVLAGYGMSRRIEVIILRMAPMIPTREPYEWGLLLYPETAAIALADAAELSGVHWYETYNICNEDVTAMSGKKWRER